MPWERAENFIAILGGNTFKNAPDLIVYRGEPIFRLHRHTSSGKLAISFDIYDETGTERMANVVKSKFYPNRKYSKFKDFEKPFAIEDKVYNYTIREKSSGRMVCSIKQREGISPVELEVSVSLYMPDGYLFEATPEKIVTPNNNEIIGCTFRNAGIVLRCKNDPPNRNKGVVVLVSDEFCSKPPSSK
jgi:hypothetical protein